MYIYIFQAPHRVEDIASQHLLASSLKDLRSRSPKMKYSTVFHLLGVAHAHTIMQAYNGNPQGAGIYMPSDDSVTTQDCGALRSG
jgi:hypothetical protein